MNTTRIVSSATATDGFHASNTKFQALCLFHKVNEMVYRVNKMMTNDIFWVPVWTHLLMIILLLREDDLDQNDQELIELLADL